MAARSSSAKTSGALDPALPQKKRARRRLVGAAAVCLAAAIVLPIVLDSEPRQIRDDVQVQIPSRDTPLSEPLPGPSRSGVIGAPPRADDGRPAAERQAAAQPGDVKSDPSTQPGASDAPVAAKDAAPADPPARETLAREAAPASAAATDAAAPDAAAKESAAMEAAAKEAAAKESATREAAAKSAGKPSGKDTGKDSPAKAPVFVLQVGAFASEKGASEQLERVRKAGLKGYTERIKTPQGERIRVRVGPFTTRDAAEQARTTLRGIGLEPALIAP